MKKRGMTMGSTLPHNTSTLLEWTNSTSVLLVARRSRLELVFVENEQPSGAVGGIFGVSEKYKNVAEPVRYPTQPVECNCKRFLKKGICIHMLYLRENLALPAFDSSMFMRFRYLKNLAAYNDSSPLDNKEAPEDEPEYADQYQEDIGNKEKTSRPQDRYFEVLEVTKQICDIAPKYAPREFNLVMDSLKEIERLIRINGIDENVVSFLKDPSSFAVKPMIPTEDLGLNIEPDSQGVSRGEQEVECNQDIHTQSQHVANISENAEDQHQHGIWEPVHDPYDSNMFETVEEVMMPWANSVLPVTILEDLSCLPRGASVLPMSASNLPESASVLPEGQHQHVSCIWEPVLDQSDLNMHEHVEEVTMPNSLLPVSILPRIESVLPCGALLLPWTFSDQVENVVQPPELNADLSNSALTQSNVSPTRKLRKDPQTPTSQPIKSVPWPRSPFPDTPGLSSQPRRQPQTPEVPRVSPNLLRVKKSVLYPPGLVQCFKAKSAENSKNNKETGALLAGFFSTEKTAFVISHIIFPKQVGMPTYYTETDGNNYGTLFIEKQLTQLGTIHSHPNFQSFMSSVDLHMHAFIQRDENSAVAIVYSPLYETAPFFTITDLGLGVLLSCDQTDHDEGHTHEQDDATLYTAARHATCDPSLTLSVLDCREESNGENEQHQAETNVIGKLLLKLLLTT